MSMPDIDGCLVGGASLDHAKFARIMNFKVSLQAIRTMHLLDFWEPYLPLEQRLVLQQREAASQRILAEAAEQWCTSECIHCE